MVETLHTSGEAVTSLKIQPRQGVGVAVSSTGVDADGWLDSRHAADHEDLSPPLSWTPVEGAAAWALVVEDPDAPRELPFVHWLLWNIPGHVTALPEGMPNNARLVTPQDAVQGRNDNGGHGWFGCLPPVGHGPHRYHFQLFALDGPLELGPETDLRTLTDAMKGRVIAQGELIGRYERRDPLS